MAWGLLISAVTVAAMGAATVGVVSATTDSDSAQVVRHVDGDTFVALVEGREEKVRLLNVDTPETKDPDTAVQCLGPEASASLASLIPVGSTVTLEYDEQRLDPYGRTLAGVFTDDDVLVNAELARQGLGVAELYEPNDRFYPEVVEAQEEARGGQRGAYSPNVECTLPGQVAAVERELGETMVVAARTPEEAETVAGRADAVVAAAGVARGVFDGPRIGMVWDAFDRQGQDRYAARVTAARDGAATEGASRRSAAADARAQAAAQVRAAADARRAADDARRAADARARERAAAADRQAATEAREAQAEERRQASATAAARRAAASADDGSSSTSSSSSRGSSGSSSSSSGGPAGYTGPRCYAPGGKTWRPC